MVADGPYAANPKKIDETEQYIPDRYNVRSELSVEIVPGENRCDFTLASETIITPQRAGQVRNQRAKRPLFVQIGS